MVLKSVATTALLLSCVSIASGEPAIQNTIAFLQNAANGARAWTQNCNKKEMIDFFEQCKSLREALFKIEITPENVAAAKAELESAIRARDDLRTSLADTPKLNSCQPEIIDVNGCAATISVSLTTLRGKIRGFEIRNSPR